MQLFISPTSPFARLVLVTALRSNLTDLELKFVNPWENPIEFIKINPFSQVPALLTDNNNLITETPVIINYFAPQIFTDESQTALICYAITTLSQAVKAFSTQRFQPKNVIPHPFIQRATKVLQDTLPISPMLDPSSEAWGQIFLGVSLGYVQLRLPEIYENSVSEDNQRAVEKFKQRAFMQHTAIPHLEQMASLSTQQIVTVGSL